MVTFFGSKSNFNPLIAELEDYNTRKMSGSTTDETSISDSIDDRSRSITITDDDSGYIWLYEYDDMVYLSTNKYVSMINNGLVAKGSKRASAVLERFIKDTNLDKQLSITLTWRHIIGFGVLKFLLNRKNKVIDVLPIPSDECNPIRNLQTGKLGLTNINPENKKQKVAIVQKGNVATYTNTGDVSYELKYFYLSDNEVAVFTMSDIGKIKSRSRVAKARRFVERKWTDINTFDLIIKRFGPQVIVTLGNEKINFSKDVAVPKSYYTDSNGNTIDHETALSNYKTDLINAINTSMKKWLEGDTLGQIKEYGIDIEVLQPKSGMLDYVRYIELWDDKIKTAIFGLDFPGRIDVNSSRMMNSIPVEFKSQIEADRISIINELNNKLAKRLLREAGYRQDSAWFEFKPLDKTEEQLLAEIERLRSDALYNYAKAGADITKLPDDIKNRLEIDIKETKPLLTISDLNGIKAKEGEDNADAKRRRDLQKGR